MANLREAADIFGRMEQLAAEDSVIHRIHPTPKVVLTLFYILVVLSFPRYGISGLVPMLFFPAIATSMSGTSYGPLLKRAAFALPFAAAAGLGNIFFNREPAFYLSSITVTYGMLSCLSLIIKTLLTVFAALLLASTTPFVKIHGSLVQMRVPEIIGLQLILTYRYISVLLEEASKMYCAYSLRSAEQGGVRLRDMGSFLGQMILRGFDRAERVYAAMKCRGFNGASSIGRAAPMTASGVLLTGAVAALILVPRVCNISQLIGKFIG